MILSDRLTGLAIAALGGAAAWAGSRLPPVPGQQVGPNVFPTVIGLGLVACGVMVALGIGRGFEEEAEADLAAVEAKAAEPIAAEAPSSRLGAWLALLPPALLVGYALVVDALGFVPTAFAMILVMALAFGGRLRVVLPIALIAPVVIHLVFFKLRVPLPDGLLAMPWS